MISVLSEVNIQEVLEKLSLSNKTRAAILTSSETRARMKMLDAIDIQIAVAEGDRTGEPYIKRSWQYVTDDETGERVKKEVPFRIRRWWWKDANGQIMLDVRYGNCSINPKAGKIAIGVGEMGTSARPSSCPQMR